jgi:transposase
MMMVTVGLDIAKQIFQAHGIDRTGKVVLRKRLRRTEVSSFFAEVEPCLIGLEASGGAHYWFRVLSRLGHTVRLIAPQFVKPYVKSQKNDANDAEAICEAVARPRFADYWRNMGLFFRSMLPNCVAIFHHCCVKEKMISFYRMDRKVPCCL